MEWLILIGIGIYIYSILSNKTESRSKQPASENKEPPEWVRAMRLGANRSKQPASKNRTPAKRINPRQTDNINSNHLREEIEARLREEIEALTRIAGRHGQIDYINSNHVRGSVSKNRGPAEWVRSMRLLANRPKQRVSENKTDRPDHDSSGVDLSDFRMTIDINSSRVREPVEPVSKNREPAKWIDPGQTVKIANFDIKGGYFYCGGQLNALHFYGNNGKEASLIDPELKVDTSSPDYNGDQMGYWSYYFYIPPQSRAAYLEWLASNRDDPACYIGYVFLYFYGIERRLLIDGKHISSSERRALIDEILRLKRIYGGNHSFNRYATGLLAHAWALYNREEQPDESLLAGTREFTSVFKYLLGKAVDEGAPVSSELALTWVRSHPLRNRVRLVV